MDIGKFDKTVVFKRPSTTASLTGGQLETGYTTIATTYGHLTKSSSSRGLSFGESAIDGSYSLWVEYQDTIHSAIRSDLKVEIESTVYTVSGWEKIEEKRYFLKFKLERQDG
jgi:head-tail adaptor